MDAGTCNPTCSESLVHIAAESSASCTDFFFGNWKRHGQLTRFHQSKFVDLVDAKRAVAFAGQTKTDEMLAPVPAIGTHGPDRDLVIGHIDEIKCKLIGVLNRPLNLDF